MMGALGRNHQASIIQYANCSECSESLATQFTKSPGKMTRWSLFLSLPTALLQPGGAGQVVLDIFSSEKIAEGQRRTGIWIARGGTQTPYPCVVPIQVSKGPDAYFRAMHLLDKL